MLTSGQTIALTVDKPAAGGRMIARADGLVVLVAGAIPGERVRASVERIGKGVAYAHVVSVEEPSSDRRSPSGDPQCGGCLYAHIAYPRQLEIKAAVIADAFARIGHLELPAPPRVAPSPDEGYRMRARLHARDNRLGFFREGTHELCDVRQTRQLLPATCDALERLAAALRSLGLNSAREIELTENVEATDRVVRLEAGVAPQLVRRLAEAAGLSGLVSGAAVSGSPYVTDRLGGASLRRHVAAFFQGNRFLLQDLVTAVVGQVPEGSEVLDLYAGTGLFAVSAAVDRGARVTAVEGDRYSAADLVENALASGGSVLARHESVEQFVASGAAESRPVSSIIVDPPRSGMSREALDGVVALEASRVIYVSCDVATLARDARRLTDAGYAIAGLEVFDMFPNTAHVEVVVVFEDLRI